MIRAKEAMVFLKGSMARYREVGMPLPSSGLVAEGLASMIPYPEVKNIIEAGAGTGRLSKAIARRQPPGSQLICVEKNPDFCRYLSASLDGSARVLNCTLEQIFLVDKPVPEGSTDCVVLSLPARFASDETRQRWASTCDRLLRRGGYLVNQQCVPVMTGHFLRRGWRLRKSRWLIGFPPFKVELFQKPL